MNNCEKCPLPKIVSDLNQIRIIAEIAASNADAGDVISDANPYLNIKKEALIKLENQKSKFVDFVNMWDGTCEGCKFGA